MTRNPTFYLVAATPFKALRSYFTSHGISRSFALPLIALFALAGFMATPVMAAPKATDSGRVSFPMEAKWKNKKISEGAGKLALPKNANGKAPVVILAHGTKGVGYRERQWAAYLNNRGYATFTLDYFKPRGVSGKGKDVPRPPEDVWGAINYISTHPGLDANRIAVMGFSNGGSVTRSAIAVNPTSHTKGILPKAFIMVYGGCHSTAKTYSADYKPALLYIAGGKDALVKASTCLERKKDTSSSDLEVYVVEGAHHLFDGDSSKTFRHPKWGMVTIKADKAATKKARAKVMSLLKRVF